MSVCFARIRTSLSRNISLVFSVVLLNKFQTFVASSLKIVFLFLLDNLLIAFLLPLTSYQVYVARSPINNAGNITCPLLLLQGSIDKVVPIEQATLMAERITKAPVEVIIFEGEGHGFRRYDSKKRAMESELHHYRKTWSIEAAEKE